LKLGLREQLPDVVEQPDIGGRVRPRRAPDRRLVDVDDLVDLVEAVDAPVGARPLLGAVEAVGHGLVEHLVDERGLARSGHAGDRAEDAQRDLGVDVLEVVLRGALDLHVAARAAPLLGDRDLDGAREVLPGERVRHLHDVLRSALGHQLAPVLAGSGTEVEQVVGGAHRALVVLDHDHGVAEVAQPLERGDQARVVALVEADRRLVEDVEDAHEARADLGGEPDPLRLAARERGRGALEREVAHAHVVEEAQPLVDLAQHEPGDLTLGVGQLELVEPRDRPLGGHVSDLADAEPADLDRERLGPQPRPLALRARTHRHVLLDLLARVVGVCLSVAALEVGHDALEGGHVRAAAPVAVAVGDVDPVAVRAVQERLANLLGQVLPGDVHVHFPLLGDRLRHLVVVVRGARGPGQDRALGQRQARVRDDQVGIDLHLRAEAGAARAGAVGGVEREHPRLELGHRGAAVEAHEAVGVGGHASVVHHLHVNEALRAGHSRLDRVRQPLAQVVAHHQPVDHDRDVVLVLLVEDDVLFEALEVAVDLHAREALGAEVLEQVLVLALAAADHRSEHHELGALLEGHHLIDDLLGRLRLDRAAAVVAMRMADPGPQQPQVVVDLGDGADRGARIAARGLLIDRDRRREPLDRVHVGLVHLAQELARVGRQRLDVAALALGVDRVEGEARLARSGQPGDHDQGMPRQPQMKVPEVVLARS
jgi:hypothetical protein